MKELKVGLKALKARSDAPSSVLFICGMNVVRSPMASAITRTLFPHVIYTRSAGVHKGENDPFVKIAMEELGVDISTHYPHTYAELDDENFDLTIALTREAKDYAEELTASTGSSLDVWLTEDPTLEKGNREQRLNAYRKVRDTLIDRIKVNFCG